MDISVPPLRARIRAHYLRDEAEALAELLEARAPRRPMPTRASPRRARELVETVRAKQRASAGMQSFLQEYDLSSREGVLLMCVAEALLRIPDAATADKLIRDKFSQGEWEQHLGKSRSLLVNAGHVGHDAHRPARERSTRRRRAQRRQLGRQRLRRARASRSCAWRCARAMKLMAEQFVMGRTIEDALARARGGEHPGCRHSYDMLGRVGLHRRRRRALLRGVRAGDRRHRRGRRRAGPGSCSSGPAISIKLSALHPRYEFAQRERVLAELTPRVQALAERARRGRHRRHARRRGGRPPRPLARHLRARVRLRRRSPAGKASASPSRPTRSARPHVIDWLADLARRGGRRIIVRLVKGAYWDAEIKRAQVQGLAGYPVFTRKCNTDVSYLACAAKMLAAPEAFYGQFATHNAHTVATDPRARTARAGPSSSSACTAWARSSTRRSPAGWATRAASTPRWEATRTCCRTSCAACWKTAPTPRS